MNESMWGYFIIVLGIIICVVLLLVYNYSSANESDYYNLKETTEAAAIESIDYGEWGRGLLKINEESFIESFIRRFAETTNGNQNYKIEFFNIYEEPPKVSVSVTTETGEYAVKNQAVSVPIINKTDGILVFGYESDDSESIGEDAVEEEEGEE